LEGSERRTHFPYPQGKCVQTMLAGAGPSHQTPVIETFIGWGHPVTRCRKGCDIVSDCDGFRVDHYSDQADFPVVVFHIAGPAERGWSASNFLIHAPGIFDVEAPKHGGGIRLG
jgi:hypothetical protein